MKWERFGSMSQMRVSNQVVGTVIKGEPFNGGMWRVRLFGEMIGIYNTERGAKRAVTQAYNKWFVAAMKEWEK